MSSFQNRKSLRSSWVNIPNTTKSTYRLTAGSDQQWASPTNRVLQLLEICLQKRFWKRSKITTDTQSCCRPAVLKHTRQVDLAVSHMMFTAVADMAAGGVAQTGWACRLQPGWHSREVWGRISYRRAQSDTTRPLSVISWDVLLNPAFHRH